MWEVIGRLVESKVTVLLTTQYLEEADKLADRIAVLDHGKIIAEGTASELKDKVGKERLELTLKEGTDFQKALQIIDGAKIQSDEKKKTISLSTQNSVSEVKRILGLMEDHKVEIETLSLHKPTLDDVFLQLTGHHSEEIKEEN
jgi:ABC-2 type transport system ATP-binding protein